MALPTAEYLPANPELDLGRKARSRANELLRDFATDHTTPAVLNASNLYADYRERGIDVEQALKQHSQLTPREFKQVWGIATDYPVVRQYLASDTWQTPQHENRWAHATPIRDVDSLMSLGESVNIETILIHAAHTLAIMDVYDGQSDTAYDAVVNAESVLAPLCEIASFDGPAMALRSKAEIIRMRNSGLGHFVDESERISLMYQDENGDCGPRFHHFASCILREITGSSNLRPILGADSKHDIVLEDGFNDEKGIREIARLKTIGMRANKLYRSFKDNGGIMEVNLDDVGITVVAKDDEHLTQAYIDAVYSMLKSQHITPWPSPRRKESFHIRGSSAFVEQLKAALIARFDPAMFEFVEDDTGFHVAKMTGYYEDAAGCVPFEVQVLTQEGRKDSRTGKSAHIFYKIMRMLGVKYVPTEEQTTRLAAFNARRAHMGTDGLCPPSEQRFANFIDDLGLY